MDYIYTAIAVFLGLVGGYTDIREGKVKNTHILVAIVSWLIAIVVGWLIGWMPEYSFLAYVLNLSLAGISTVILYLKDIWAPGDGKLFLAITMIYPVSMNPCMVGNIFPSLDIVIYAFAVGYVFLLATTILRRKSRKSKMTESITTRVKQHIHVINVVTNFGIFSALDMVLLVALPGFFEANRSLCAICLAGIVFLMYRLAPTTRKIIGCVCLCAFAACSQINEMWGTLLLPILQGIFFSTAIEIVNDRISKNCYRVIDGSELKPGMILSQTSIWAMQNCIDTSLPRSTTETRRSRLNSTQVQAVQLWCRNAKSKITVVEMIPFAPCISIAVIIHFARYILFYR